MLNLLKKSLRKLKESNEFKNHKKENPDIYLTSAFLMLGEDSQDKWQIDFYSPKKHKITSFIVDKNISVIPSEQIFQKEKKKLEELDITKVKISVDNAFKKIDKILKKKFPSESPSKKIIIIQMIKGKEVWNISYITTTFNLINTKIDAKNGKVLESKLQPLIDLRKN